MGGSLDSTCKVVAFELSSELSAGELPAARSAAAKPPLCACATGRFSSQKSFLFLPPCDVTLLTFEHVINRRIIRGMRPEHACFDHNTSDYACGATPHNVLPCLLQVRPHRRQGVR